MRLLDTPIQATVNYSIDQIPEDQAYYKVGQKVKIVGLEPTGMVRVEGLSRKIWLDRLDLPQLGEAEQQALPALVALHETRERLVARLRRLVQARTKAPARARANTVTITPEPPKPKTKKKSRTKERSFIAALSSKKFSQRAQSQRAS